jgi:2-amino-4-hydroxy-6-hydroxymethyldihydropteridine diphosphokinase
MVETNQGGNHSVFVSVGSNIGSKRLNCQKGISAIAASKQVNLLDHSPFYRTEPMDYTNQGWFVNCAVRIETALSPTALLSVLKKIEKDMGRQKDTVRFGPRILDMDIVLYDTLVLVSPSVVIPHPRMHRRRFVLQPICDIDSKTTHPVLKKSVEDLLNRLDANTQRIVIY